MYFRSHNGLSFIRPKPALNRYVAFCEINVADFIPRGFAHQTVRCQAELLLEIFYALFGGGIEGSGDFGFAKGGIVLGNAGKLPLQDADAGAGRTSL